MSVNLNGIWAISHLHVSTVMAALEANQFRPYLTGYPDVPATVLEACSSQTDYTIEGYWADRLSIGQDAQVPVIPVTGILTRSDLYGNVFSTDFIISMLYNIAANDKKKGVILDFNTGGGQVAGIAEFVQAVRAVKEKKPVVSSVQFCASAGYWVGSQGSEVHMKPGTVSSVGSIGTMYMHVNRAKAMAQAGLEPEIFRSTGSIHKNRQNDIEPLDDEARAEIQKGLDASNKVFKADVRIGRGTKIKSDDVYTGKLYNTQDSIKEGLADKVADLQTSYQRVLQLSKSYA
ncbi:S49 family peptidase [Spirosoma oryzicola]|uniref:S49 family peptidase n=1 Tax=Spirosoma oryzicola TaxID=2898794 RepID=UPI001E3D1BD0|nr:S49 family peptidase [Spirosoma oryzicola]UHG90124.1 S49 family peptidase [Spirosoma oryzicola]